MKRKAKGDEPKITMYSVEGISKEEIQRRLNVAFSVLFDETIFGKHKIAKRLKML